MAAVRGHHDYLQQPVMFEVDIVDGEEIAQALEVEAVAEPYHAHR